MEEDEEEEKGEDEHRASSGWRSREQSAVLSGLIPLSARLSSDRAPRRPARLSSSRTLALVFISDFVFLFQQNSHAPRVTVFPPRVTFGNPRGGEVPLPLFLSRKLWTTSEKV